MENAPVIIERSHIDLNQIASQMIKQLSDSIANKLLEGFKHILESHNPIKPEQPKEYFSIEETCKKLDVCRTTLHNWNKKQELVPDAKCGNRPLYSNVLIDEYLSRTTDSLEDFEFNNTKN